jgi:hypothetical protein
MKTVKWVAGTVAILGFAAVAQGPMSPRHPQMTTAQRQKMADAHENMAACLRSDRPASECHDDLMKACQQTMGASTCPMMGGMGPGKHGSGMVPPPTTK